MVEVNHPFGDRELVAISRRQTNLWINESFVTHHHDYTLKGLKTNVATYTAALGLTTGL